MARCKCDWEQDTGRFELSMTEKEEQIIAGAFHKYIIVQSIHKNQRQMLCTHCKGVWLQHRERPITRLYEPDVYNEYGDYFELKHKDTTTCTLCGEEAQVIQEWKMRDKCRDMRENIPIVIFRAAENGWLEAEAWWARKDYIGKEWKTDIYRRPAMRWKLKPGAALCWESHWDYETGKDKWEKRTEVGEPFVYGMAGGYAYMIIGLSEAVQNTDMRYSAVERASGIDCGMGKTRGVMRYLGEYCHRPQLEMCVKLGMNEIVSMLIWWRKASYPYVNWKGKTLQTFLRLDKAGTKLFLSGNKTIRELAIIQGMKGNYKSKEIVEFLIDINNTHTIHDLCETAGEQLPKVIHYLNRQSGINKADIWIDYIRMARELGYDLAEQTVFLPKDIQARHDEAAKTIRVKADQEAMKKYKRRYKKLCKKFAYQSDEFFIKVPEGAADITEEGKVLHHCVARYAANHLQGKTTILFLRKMDEPEKRYGTIEIIEEKMSGKCVLLQLRGEHNNNIPKLESRAFITEWLAWIDAGSPEIKNKDKQRVRITA